MTADLVEFLRAREAEREQDALAATPGPWRHNPDKHWRKPGTAWFEEAVFAGPAGDAAVCVAGTGESDDPQSMADARHIARNDPAWVLADVAAKRLIIEHCVERLETGDPDRSPDSYDAQSYADDACAYDARTVLRLLALSEAGHPDYRADWAPST